MNHNNPIKPWIPKFKAFLVSLLLCVTTCLLSQNKLEKEIISNEIETLTIDGNQIFVISISTSNNDRIAIRSTLDGEYQDQFQIVTQQKGDILRLSLKRLPFTTKTDDKRNAHKLIAASLRLEIPENLSVDIKSDIGSVKMRGEFNNLEVALLQGHFEMYGIAESATVNTLEGYIQVETRNAEIFASSNNGNIMIADFQNPKTQWSLKSINGNITVLNQD